MEGGKKESWMLMALVTAVSLLAAGCPPVGPDDSGFPGELPIELVSLSGSGTQGDVDSYYASISADGRYAAFDSYATNLVADDTNNLVDIFVCDRQNDTVERVSLGYDGSQANNNCSGASISADGRYVAFSSSATNLVATVTSGDQVFVCDRQADTIELVSRSSGGIAGNNTSYWPSISADGRFVAFNSEADNLVAGDTNGRRDVFVHDRQNDTIERVSVDSLGTEANDSCDGASISADGRYVAFDSYATNLVAGDANGRRDIFVYDRQTATIELVSVSSGGVQGNNMSRNPSISADGRYVTFESDATNLVAADANSMMDVFVYDRQADAIELVSVSSGGIQGDGDSTGASISADGRYVAFESKATNLVAGDTNLVTDVFVYDRQTDAIDRVSVSSGGTQGNIDSTNAAISADGRYVAFESDATNLVAGDANGVKDVFAAPRP